MFSRKFIIIICTAIFLAGCTSLPIKKSPNYSLEDLYKRIPYRTEGRYRVVNIFYATSRQVDYVADAPKKFWPKLAKETTFGTLDMKIDPRLAIGVVLPDQIKNNGLVEIEKAKRLDIDVFAEKLAAAVKASPHKSLLVLIFGYKDGFEATAIKAAYFGYLLDIDTPILLFDWPGDQSVTPWGYREAQSLARDSGVYLAKLMGKLAGKIKVEKFWIAASSLGAQVTCSALDAIYNNPDFINSNQKIDHIILAAPDVSGDEFKDKFLEELKFIGKKFTVYVSSEDDALLFSGLVNRNRRLGRVKARINQPKQLEEARDLLYLKSLEPDRLTMIDVTPINVASFKHGYYLECPEFYDDFYMRILNPSPNTTRSLYLLKTREGVDYWVMQRGK